MQLVMFSKMLQEFSVAKAGEIIADLGFEGVDLTVRPGGHVRPENVTADLPPAVATLRDMGLSVPMITTAIVAAEEPQAEEIFRAAAECDIPQLKLGYWHYEGFGRLKAQLDAVRATLHGLQALAQKYGVQANIHLHSGNFLSANPAVVWRLLEGFDPQALGAYVDPGHMAVEGGYAGWKQGLDLLADRISLVAVKDFGWFREEDEAGRVRWQHKLMPLREGIVPWPEVFRCLGQIGFDGTVSLHSEYKGRHAWRDLTTAELIAQTREDLQYLREVLAEVEG